jgi:replication factor C small subunit
MILICNYASRIIPPIQSRCAVFKFSRLSDDDISDRLQHIAEEENVSMDEGGKKAILYLSNGDMRAAINILQAASSTGELVTADIVFAISGRADPKSISQMLGSAAEGDYNTAIMNLRQLIYHEGISPLDLITQIHREILKLELEDDLKMKILEHTADTEFRIAEGANGEIQISALLSIFGG